MYIYNSGQKNRVNILVSCCVKEKANRVGLLLHICILMIALPDHIGGIGSFRPCICVPAIPSKTQNNSVILAVPKLTPRKHRGMRR